MRRMLSERQAQQIELNKQSVKEANDKLEHVSSTEHTFIAEIDEDETWASLTLNGNGQIGFSSNYMTLEGTNFYAIVSNFQVQDEDEGTSVVSYVSGEGLTVDGTFNIILANLPTTDPQVAGAIWNDNGTLKISAGE